ncbi:MAG TPA: flagellar hook-length control protein FliK [Chloroflexota bacterium]|nr:flagellar hook-length control protein FliK [Chloroflexota bacterium]
MILASMAAAAPKAAPQTAPSGGEPAQGGAAAPEDQPSFHAVLAHEEHASTPPAKAVPSAPQSAKTDPAKKPTDGTAQPPPPASLLAALLAAITLPPTVTLPTSAPALGGLDHLTAAGGSAKSGKSKEPPAAIPGGSSPQLLGALEALVANRSNRSDGSEQTDRSDPSGQHGGALDAPVVGGSRGIGPNSGASLGAKSAKDVPAVSVDKPPRGVGGPHTTEIAGALIHLAESLPSLVATGVGLAADPTPRGKAGVQTVAIVPGTDARSSGERIASQGPEALLHAAPQSAPLTAREVEAALHALLTSGTAKTAGISGGGVKAGIEPTTLLVSLHDDHVQQPSMEQAPSKLGQSLPTMKPLQNLTAANPAPPELAAALAPTTAALDRGVKPRALGANGDDHGAPAPLVGPTITTEGAARPIALTAAAHASAQSQPPQPSEPEAPTPAPASPATLTQSANAQARTGTTPVAPLPAGQTPTEASRDHRAGSATPTRLSDAASIQSWANGASTTNPAAQHAQSAEAARPAAPSRDGAVYQPIAQGVLVRQASLRAAGDTSSFKVILHPRSLGEVTVHVTRVQEGLQVTITPQQLTTQTLLNKHLPDLLGMLRMGSQDLTVQAQVVAPHASVPIHLGVPEAPGAGQSGLNFAANGGGQQFSSQQGGGEQQAWAGTMNDLFTQPAGISMPAVSVATAAVRAAGNSRIDVQA